ncbi:hypothetical protein LTR84_001454 [Exophiala bonariae]|uniref:BZIP domain-containing protein n=1 Tax=Exophiala bonariae TaxID=1690606 RepID=A0AAV9NCN0_9EURO|nr:hypothetical protein LTR84_001454 [Exophiala bonariae]
MDPNGSQYGLGSDNPYFQSNPDEAQFQMDSNNNNPFAMDSYGTQVQMNADRSNIQLNANGTQVQMGANGFQVQLGTRSAHYQQQMRQAEDLQHRYTRLNREYQRLLHNHDLLRQREARLAEDNRSLRDQLNARQFNQSAHQAQMAGRNVPVQPLYQQTTESERYATRYPQQQTPWALQVQQQQQQLQEELRQQRQQFASPPALVENYQGLVNNRQPPLSNGGIDLTFGDVPVGVALVPPVAPLPVAAGGVGTFTQMLVDEQSIGEQQPFLGTSSITTGSESSPSLPVFSSGEEASETVTPNTDGMVTQAASDDNTEQSPANGKNSEKRTESDDTSEEHPAKRRRIGQPDWLPPSRNRALNLAQNNLQGQVVKEAEQARIIDQLNMEEDGNKRKARMEQLDRKKKAKAQKAKEEKEARQAQKEEERERNAAEKLARDEKMKAQRALVRKAKAAEKQAADKRAEEEQVAKMAEKQKHVDEDHAAAATTTIAPAGPIAAVAAAATIAPAATITPVGPIAAAAAADAAGAAGAAATIPPAPIPAARPAQPVRRALGLGHWVDMEDKEDEDLFGGDQQEEPQPERESPSQEEETEEEYDEAGFMEDFDELEGETAQGSQEEEGKGADEDEDGEYEVEEEPQQQVEEAVQREVDEESEVSEEE